MSNALIAQKEKKQGRVLDIRDEIDAITQLAQDESRDLTDDDVAQIDARNAEFDQLTKDIEKLDSTIKIQEKIASGRVFEQSLSVPGNVVQPHPNLPKVRSSYGIKSKYFQSTSDCYAVGMWMQATLMQRPDAQRWVRDNAPDASFRQAMEGGTDTLGGYTVPTPLAATIIELFEQWGVFRQYARNVAMTSNTLDVPRLDGNLTAGWFAEGASITPSDLTFGQVNLIAKKLAALGIMSTELNEDSVISMTDLLARDIARMFSFKEDDAAFNGDGTGAYGNITGIKSALQAGAIVTGGSTIGSLTMNDYESAAGKAKPYAGFMGRWYMPKETYYTSVLSLLNQQGGTDMRQTEQGGELMFLGDPVTFTQVLPSASATTGDMVAVYGDLDLGAYCGTRRNVSIRVLNELFAQTDQIGVMGTIRHDAVTHSVGDATDAGAITAIFLGA